MTSADLDRLNDVAATVLVLEERLHENRRREDLLILKIDQLIGRMDKVEASLTMNKAFTGGVIFTVTCVFSAITWALKLL